MSSRTRPQVRRSRDERGASAVEFALVILPLLGLVFSLIAYGYMLSFRRAISQGAAAATRAAAIWHAPCAAVTISYPYADGPLIPAFSGVPLPGSLAYTAETRAS